MPLSIKSNTSIKNRKHGHAAGLKDGSIESISISKRAVKGMGLLLTGAWTAVYLGGDTLSQVADLYSNSFPTNPYFFHAGHPWLIYLLTPLVLISSIILFLSPGIFLVLAAGRSCCWADLIIQSFGTSFILYFFLISIVKFVSPPSPPSFAFFTAVSLSGALTWAILVYRVWRGAKLPWPLSRQTDIRRLIWTVAIPFITLVLLIPIIFWQDMNDDGLEALELGRSLSAAFMPRFPTAIGLSGLVGVGMVTMAYPVHWFLTLFGPIEASARLPMLLYLPVLFCLLICLIESGSPRSLGLPEEALLCLALAIYTVTMSYNASYDPYFADMAAPAAFETLTVLCILATIYFLWCGKTFWFFVFALMSYLCRPTGILVLGLIGFAVLFFLQEYRKFWLTRICIAIAICILITTFYKIFYIPSSEGGIAGLGIPFSSLLFRFLHLRMDDFSRFNFILFPSGIVPLISLLAFRWQDLLARLITFVSLSYFLFFYFPAFIALHHFVPAMIFPLIVFWRLYLHHQPKLRRPFLFAAALMGIFAFWLSLPRHFEINRTVRGIGQKTACLVGDYENDYRSLAKHKPLFFRLIPPDWEVKDPSKELVSGYLSLIYYSTRPKSGEIPINYIIQSPDNPAPIGLTRVASDKDAVLYVKNPEEWHRDRTEPPRTDYRSPLYDIPRKTLFRYWGVPLGNYSIDFRSLPLSSKLLEKIRKQQ